MLEFRLRSVPSALLSEEDCGRELKCGIWRSHFSDEYFVGSLVEGGGVVELRMSGITVH